MPRLTRADWVKINAKLDESPEKFGLPERRADSFVFSSFNIRRLGAKRNRNSEEWEFLRRYCRQCDLIAVQEVQDDLEGLSHLKELLGPNYGMAASDITGAKPGESSSSSERLAFLFNWTRISRTEIASDLTFDRSSVLGGLYEEREAFAADFDKREADLAKWEKKRQKRIDDWIAGGKVGKKPKAPAKPPFVLSNFLTFIRTPYCVSFRAPGLGDAEPYEFLAVDAHLLYGHKSKQKEERELEFQALVLWLIWRAQNVKNLYHKNLILFGDLNLDFEETDQRRDRIETFIKSLNAKQLDSLEAARLNFPFLDIHPSRRDIADPNEAFFRSTARLTQTYDQIALLIDDKRLPNSDANDTAGTPDADDYDYGVFNFTELFAQALHKKNYKNLSKTKKQELIKSYEHKVSDHLPIWIRLRVPGT